MYAISSYHGNRPTNKQTQPHTHRQDRLQYTASQLAHSVTSSPQRFFFRRFMEDLNKPGLISGIILAWLNKHQKY